MKIEFFKLSRSIIALLWLIIAAAILLGSAFYYNAHLNHYQGTVSDVPPYNSRENLLSEIKNLEANLAEAKAANDDNVGWYERQIEASSYVYEHYVPYENLTDLTDRSYSRCTPVFFVYLENNLTYPLLILMVLLPIVVFCSSFTNGTYKNEYIGETKRWKHILKKYAVCIITTAAITFFIGFLSLLFSLAYYESTTVVLTNALGRFFLLPSLTLIAVEIVESVAYMCTIETVMFALALLIKNPLWTIFAESALVFVMIVSIGERIPELKCIEPFFLCATSTGESVSIPQYIQITVIRVILIFVLMFAGLLTFEKRDL